MCGDHQEQMTMKHADLGGVLQKVEELRAMMVFMRRTLPFLEDVFTFVREIVPLLEVLKNSVESTSEKLPKASLQLNKVTTATELASTEILNIVEGIATRTEQMRADMDGRKAAVNGLLELLDRLPAAAGTDGTVAEMRLGIRGLAPAASQYTELEDIQNDCTNIMIALQVQDITAQQIASVNELMKSVDEGLSRLLRNFEKSSKHDASKFKHQKLNIVFDTSAEYSGGAERQRMADALVQEAKHTPARKQQGKKRPSRK
jgi:chemotaxis regulatin CheY-phosphate phosphatase CheZ